MEVGSEEFFDTLDSSAELYKKYQMAIHKDPIEECDKNSFVNFLAKSPLQVHFGQTCSILNGTE